MNRREQTFVNAIPLRRAAWMVALIACALAVRVHAQQDAPAPSPGPYVTGAEFPIGVWLQSPANAGRYKAAGINLYVGLWEGPTAEQLAALTRTGMRVICEQNAAGLAAKGSPIIVGWMHGDEPDNAQELPKEKGGGYGPPITPEKIVADYARMKVADPSRPVLLNLGMGVAWDGWFGRGVRTNHPEDYARYVKGSDITSFDIYPVTFDKPAVAGKLEYVPLGVRRLVEWAGPTRPVWSCIECTHVSNAKAKPTPAQVRAEVWMAIIGGARGIVYFCHEFAPAFKEAAPLDDPEMLAAMTAINKQVQELAPVLATPTISIQDVTDPVPEGLSIVTLVKRSGGSLYVLAANQTNTGTDCTLLLKKAPADSTVEVLGENRKLTAKLGDRSFGDTFEPYAVHLYRVRER